MSYGFPLGNMCHLGRQASFRSVCSRESSTEPQPELGIGSLCKGGPKGMEQRMSRRTVGTIGES